VLAITVLIIAITGLQEVSERRRELGILVAMGARYSYIAGLYLAKMLALSLVAASTGFIIGSKLAVSLTGPLLAVNTRPVTIVWGHLPGVAALACGVALVSMLVPMIQLVRLDPNRTIAEE
ncbi:MAG: ABC transporter permease, partial [Candidatus Hydrogenedentes bacterium]|nr:ABC transporter permease [Candidatus Hydrogenedentota bacterium]